jgi:hypothetical protein
MIEEDGNSWGIARRALRSASSAESLVRSRQTQAHPSSSIVHHLRRGARRLANEPLEAGEYRIVANEM